MMSYRLPQVPGRVASRIRSLTEKLVHPSTRNWWRIARASGQSFWEFLHGYVYGRWLYGYIGAAIGERRALRRLRPLFAPFTAPIASPHRWANSYHGKVVSTQQATQLITINQEVQITIPEQVIPFETARDLVLLHPDHIVVIDCPCRLARENPCLPLDVCLVVGEPFASFILSHHREKARQISPEEAVQILEQEAKRGHVHHAFFKDAMLDRFYAICNCCSCCCGAIRAQRHGTPMLISSGYVARVDHARCQACGLCAKRCPFEAITVNEGKTTIDETKCMGCGVCARSCPTGSISMVRAPEKPAPLDIESLLEAAGLPARAGRPES